MHKNKFLGVFERSFKIMRHMNGLHSGPLPNERTIFTKQVRTAGDWFEWQVRAAVLEAFVLRRGDRMLLIPQPRQIRRAVKSLPRRAVVPGRAAKIVEEVTMTRILLP
jgi:hypothetical protein